MEYHPDTRLVMTYHHVNPLIIKYSYFGQLLLKTVYFGRAFTQKNLIKLLHLYNLLYFEWNVTLIPPLPLDYHLDTQLVGHSY